ncbi:hypothetical protein [Streptomyces sp. NBC_00280]|uniref:hypothetical protein n=1 Tax=Streptomyces sp. NBC_00280 TaxID=2975699 RepID=UPI00324EEB23
MTAAQEPRRTPERGERLALTHHPDAYSAPAARPRAVPEPKGLHHLMSTLLLGHWTHSGNLVITSSHQVADGDQKAIDALVKGQTSKMAWVCAFDVDSHRNAVQRAYEEYVRDDDDADLIDEVQGVEPATG